MPQPLNLAELRSAFPFPVTGVQTDALTNAQLRLAPVAITGALTLAQLMQALSCTIKVTLDQAQANGVAITQPLPSGSNQIGQVTANAGENLNTSALALESGGNLSRIVDKHETGNTSLASIDLKMPTLVSGAQPVKLTAADIAALTPLASVAVSNFPASFSVSNFPATQAVSGPLTDTQLRNSAVLVSLASTTVTGNVAVTNAGLSNVDVALSTRTKPSDQQHAIVDSGTLTANAGTNLNTSLLSLETGGNLAAAATSAASIDTKLTSQATSAKQDALNTAIALLATATAQTSGNASLDFQAVAARVSSFIAQQQLQAVLAMPTNGFVPMETPSFLVGV
jgi:hypothetical protein